MEAIRVTAKHPKTGKTQTAKLEDGILTFADGIKQMQSKAYIVSRYSASNQTAKLTDKYGN